MTKARVNGIEYDLISPREAAQIYGASKQRMHQLVKAGRLPFVLRVDSLVLLDKKQVEDLSLTNKAHRMAIAAGKAQAKKTEIMAQSGLKP